MELNSACNPKYSVERVTSGKGGSNDGEDGWTTPRKTTNIRKADILYGATASFRQPHTHTEDVKEKGVDNFLKSRLTRAPAYLNYGERQ